MFSTNLPIVFTSALALVAVGLWLHELRKRRQLEKLVWIDDLTGLPRRPVAKDTMMRALGQVKRGSTTYALMVVDIDRFKRINDTYGHSVGDRALRFVAERLRGSVREGDVVCRWGGEEFVVVAEVPDALVAKDVAKKICEILEASPVIVGGRLLNVTVSIGVTLFHEADEKPTDTFLRADRCLLEAKDSGRNNVVFG